MVLIWFEEAEEAVEGYCMPDREMGDWVVFEGRCIMSRGFFWMPKPNSPMADETWEKVI
jgi:hypothetical protein